MTKKRKNSVDKVIYASLLLLFLSAEVKGQNQAANGVSPHHLAQPSPVPLSHLYWHFLIYQHHLDLVADQREKQGKDGRWLRTYLQKKLGFTDAEFAPIHSSADYLSAAVSNLTVQAKTIAAADRDARAKGQVASGSPPPGLEKLKALTAQREVVINDEINHLNQALTAENKVALQKFLTTTFSQNVTTLKIDPNKRPSHPDLSKKTPASVQQ